MEILLVDDNEAMRQVLAELLETGGHRVCAVSSAGDALARLEERSFDRLVTDFEMPEVDGAALIAAARLDHPRLPALLVSSSPEAETEAARIGVPFLPKPIDARRLLRAIDDAQPPRETFAPPAQVHGVGTTHDQATILVHGGQRSTRPASARPKVPKSGPLFRGLAAAALLAGAVTLTLPWIDRAPELPAPPTSGVVRGTTLELLDPTGPLAAPPAALRWRAVEGAEQYRIVVEKVDGRIVFQQRISTREPHAETLDFAVPLDLADHFAPMMIHTWWVEALDTDGTPIARSSRQRFRVLANPDLPISGGMP